MPLICHAMRSCLEENLEPYTEILEDAQVQRFGLKHQDHDALYHFTQMSPRLASALFSHNSACGSIADTRAGPAVWCEEALSKAYLVKPGLDLAQASQTLPGHPNSHCDNQSPMQRLGANCAEQRCLPGGRLA